MFRVNCDPIPKTADKRRDVESECNCRLKRRALASHNDDVPEMCMSNEGNESMYLEHNSFQQPEDECHKTTCVDSYDCNTEIQYGNQDNDFDFHVVPPDNLVYRSEDVDEDPTKDEYEDSDSTQTTCQTESEQFVPDWVVEE